MYNKLLNNVRLCLGISAVVALVGLIIGLVLYYQHDTAYAFIVTVGSGLLLFIVVIIATLIFRCLVTRPRLLLPHQQPSTYHPRQVKVLHDPPPPYKKSWGKEFERNQNTSDSRRQSSCISSKSLDLIRHLEGSNTPTTSLDKLTQLEIQRQRLSVPSASGVLERSADDELPVYDVAIQQLSPIDLLNVYRGQLYEYREESVMASCSSELGKVSPSMSLKVDFDRNSRSCTDLPNVVSESNVATVHRPAQTVVTVTT